jgi:hypothetical protein
VAELSDAELWRSVAVTSREVLLAIPDDQPWARAVAVQLIGVARYAAARPPDRTAVRVAEVADVLDALGANDIVAAAWDGDRSEPGVMHAAGRALAAAVARSDAAADAVRSALRPVLVRHLDDELAVTSMLVDAFRGKLDD